jgi:hypothetical protein
MGSGRVLPACAVVVGTLGVAASSSATLWASGGGHVEAPSAVVAGDAASLSLKVYGAAPSAQAFVNLPGDVSVVRGPAFTSLGTPPAAYGNYTLQGRWDEFISPTTNSVKVVWKTSNGQPFVPPGATVLGQPVASLEWRLGVTNPVSFQAWVTTVDLTRAFLGVSSNGGSSLTTHDITAGVPDPWNGTACGVAMPIGTFANANYIEAMFVYMPIPGPAASGALLAGAGLYAARRRRFRSHE